MRFQDLTVYQLSEKLSDLLWDIVDEWGNFAKDTCGKQLVRAADSVGANIAEGNGRFTFNDNRRHVRIARGSFYETQHGLRRAYRRKLLTPEQSEQLQQLVGELGPKSNSYLKSIGRNKPDGDDQ